MSSASTGAGVKSACAARDEAPARKRDDPSLMARGIQRQHRVNHRQAGPDQQHVFVRGAEILDRAQRFRSPRIVDDARGAATERQRLRRLIAEREDQCACLKAARRRPG